MNLVRLLLLQLTLYNERKRLFFIIPIEEKFITYLIFRYEY